MESKICEANTQIFIFSWYENFLMGISIPNISCDAKSLTIYVQVYYQRQQSKKSKNYQKIIELLQNYRLKFNGRLYNYT